MTYIDLLLDLRHQFNYRRCLFAGLIKLVGGGENVFLRIVWLRNRENGERESRERGGGGVGVRFEV